MTATVLAFPAAPDDAVPRHRDARRGRAGTVVRRLVGGLLTAMLFAGFATFLVLAIGPHVFGYRTATMLTGSMAGTIDPGDIVVSVPKPASEVEVGDVLTFQAPVADKHVETHRVIAVRHTHDGKTVVRTQGDANEAPDPWRATIEGDTVWETAQVVPALGKVVRALRTPPLKDAILWTALGASLLLGLSLIWRRSPEPVRTPAPEPDTATSPNEVALDETALVRLGDDIGEPSFVTTFVGLFRDLLDPRLRRLCTALDDDDLDSALDASLSLKASSSTVGAQELAELACTIERDVRRRDVISARRDAGDLVAVAVRADAALASYLARQGGQRNVVQLASRMR